MSVLRNLTPLLELPINRDECQGIEIRIEEEEEEEEEEEG